jgi:polyhydroxyalkanoate synthesis repressor PhaR
MRHRERVKKVPTPRLIRRYGNRKLYDATARAYVTLEDLRELVGRGEDLQVLDQKTGEDMTSLTLAQILLEAQRARTARIPRLLLVQLVRLTAGAGTAQGATPRLAVRRDIARAISGLVAEAQASLEAGVQRLLGKAPSARPSRRFERARRRPRSRRAEASRLKRRRSRSS